MSKCIAIALFDFEPFEDSQLAIKRGQKLRGRQAVWTLVIGLLYLYRSYLIFFFLLSSFFVSPFYFTYSFHLENPLVDGLDM